MALIGSIEHYNPEKEEFSSYVERLEQLFLCNDVEEKKKVPLFITFMGAEAYEVLKNLCSPDIPSTKGYSQLVETLRKHYAPRVLEIAERFRFYNSKQKSNQSISNYIVEIKKLSKSCNFGEFLPQALRDRLVCGMASESLQKKLLSTENLNFDQACKIALSHEVAEEQSRILQPGMVHKVFHKQVNKNTSSQVKENSKSEGPKVRKCRRCARFHDEKSCPAINWQCFICKVKGHTSRVCRKRPVKYVEVNEVEEEEEHELEEVSHRVIEVKSKVSKVNQVQQKNHSRPVVVKVNMEGKEIEMEVDTGTESTILPLKLFRSMFPNVKIEYNKLTLKTLFAGKSIAGIACVRVSYKGQSHKLKVVIAEYEESTCLMGRAWLDIIFGDWRKSLFAVKSVQKVYHTQMNCNLDNLRKEYADVFTGSKPVTVYKARIHLKPNVSPKFCKPYRVPYALKDKVSEELKELVNSGILEPVEFSNWASPIVVVPKNNGKIRICGDFKNTLNPVIEQSYYPLPTMEEIFAAVEDSRVFSVLDLSNAFLQIPLAEECKDLLTVNTPSGLFRYTRLPFGIKNSPSIFQSIIDEILKDEKNAMAYLDDVLIVGQTVDDNKRVLKNVLDLFRKFQVTVNWDKCKFFESSLEYLGHKLSDKGIQPCKDKVDTILDTPIPENKKQLQSYLGLLHYYGKFIPMLASKLSPLYKLLNNNNNFEWTKAVEDCYKRSKTLLVDSQILVPFNTKLPLVLTCDASPYGVGAILSHILDNGEERPILFASATLSKAERNYAHLEKEALAIVYGVKIFYKYLYGRKFTLVTDNRPLQSILAPNKNLPSVAAARIQRWAVTLAAFDYDIQYKTGKNIPHVDALSRLPVSKNVTEEHINYFSIVKELPMSYKDIARETDKDTELSVVKNYVLNGWPCKTTDVLKPYSNLREDINVDQNCLTYKNRVIVPMSLRKRVLLLLHEQHPGTVRMKMLARQYVFWVNINKDIEDCVKSCKCCQSNLANTTKVPLSSWAWTKRKWQRLHLDFAMKNGKTFLILVDSCTKWVDVWYLKSTTAEKVINCIRKSFAVFGLPDEIVTDNGPPFNSEEFILFCTRQGIKVIKTPPLHPTSNGAVERYVQIFKKSLLKQVYDDPAENINIQSKIDNFLFAQRNMPSTVTEQTPAEMLLKQRPKTRLTLLKPNFNEKMIDKQIKRIEKSNNNKQLEDYKTFEVGENVYIKNVRNENFKWSIGEIKVKVSPLTYIVAVNDYYRHVHVDHIRKCNISDRKEEYPVIIDNLKDVECIENNDNTVKIDVSNSVCDNIVKLDCPTDNTKSSNDCILLRRSSRTIKPPKRYEDFVK